MRQFDICPRFRDILSQKMDLIYTCLSLTVTCPSKTRTWRRKVDNSPSLRFSCPDKKRHLSQLDSFNLPYTVGWRLPTLGKEALNKKVKQYKFGRHTCPSLANTLVPVWQTHLSQFGRHTCPSLGDTFVPVWETRLSQFGRHTCPSLADTLVLSQFDRHTCSNASHLSALARESKSIVPVCPDGSPVKQRLAIYSSTVQYFLLSFFLSEFRLNQKMFRVSLAFFVTFFRFFPTQRLTYRK